MNSDLEEMRRLLEADGKASQALRELRQRGLDIESVLNALFSFCGGSLEEVRGGLARAKEVRDKCIDWAERAEQLAKDWELIQPQMEELFRSWRHTPYDLPELLRGEADWNRGIVRAKVGPYLDDVRIGGTTKRRKEAGKPAEPKANITAGRDQHLVHLAYLVSGGEKPQTEHLMLLAPLVAALLKDESPLRTIVDRLRQRIDRFSRRFGEDAQTIKGSVQDELEELQERTVPSP